MKRVFTLLLVFALFVGCSAAPQPVSDPEPREAPPPETAAPAAAPAEETPAPEEEAPTEEATAPEEAGDALSDDLELPPGFDGLPHALREAAARALEEGKLCLVWPDPPEELMEGMLRVEPEEQLHGGDLLLLALREETAVTLTRGFPRFDDNGMAVSVQGLTAAQLSLSPGEGVRFAGMLSSAVPLYHLEIAAPEGELYFGITRRMLSLINGPLGLAPAEGPASPPYYGAQDLVTNTQHLVVDFWDAADNRYQLEMDVPRLRLLSRDAAVINEELVLRGSRELRVLNDVESHRYTPAVWNMDYVAFRAPQGVLSLFLRIWSEGETREYSVYNLEIESGRRLSDEELIQMRAKELKDDPARWWPAARRAALAQAFSPAPETWDSLEPDARAFAEQQWENTLNDPKGLTRVYLDDLGRLCMVAPVYSMAGADFYMQELPVG